MNTWKYMFHKMYSRISSTSAQLSITTEHSGISTWWSIELGWLDGLELASTAIPKSRGSIGKASMSSPVVISWIVIFGEGHNFMQKPSLSSLLSWLNSIVALCVTWISPLSFFSRLWHCSNNPLAVSCSTYFNPNIFSSFNFFNSDISISLHKDL